MSSNPPDRNPALPNYDIVPRKDLGPVADLWVASWQATLPGIDFVERRSWFCASVAEVEQRGGATVCAYDSQDLQQSAPCGFILLDIPRSILEQIAVAPQRFGSGLAGLLLDHAKSLCRDGLSLAVNLDNPRALRFYEKHGFVPAGEGVNPRSGLAIRHMRWPSR